MKALTDNLRQLLHRPTHQARITTELLAAYAEAVKVTQAQQDAGTKSNVTTYPDGRVTLTPSTTAKISHTAGSDFLTDITGTRPFHVLWWRLDDSIGADAELQKVECYLTRRRVGGNPVFDGDFVLKVWRLVRAGQAGGIDYWDAQLAADPYVVHASDMSTDTELVAFTFGAAGKPAPITLGRQFMVTRLQEFMSGADQLAFAGRRVVGISIEAIDPHSTGNYAWVSEAAQGDKHVGGAGDLYHRYAGTPSGAKIAEIVKYLAAGAATGMPRATFSIGSYPATGTLTFTGSARLDLGAAPTGEVEFIVHGLVPQGTTLTAEASDDNGANWHTITDGILATAAGLASQQLYAVRWSFAANSSTDVSPTALEIAALDRTKYDLSEIATWESEERGVDPLTGQYRVGTATVRLALAGKRDYRSIERLLSETNPTRWQVRKLWGHPSLARKYWLLQDLYDLDDWEINAADVELRLLGVAGRMKGTYPATTDTLVGFVCKDDSSDLSGGANFSRVLQEGAESAGSIAVSVAGSSTEVDYFFSPATVPNLYWWPLGDWTIKVRVTVANSNIWLKVRVTQVLANGTVVKSTAYTDEQNITATGTYTFTIRNVAWDKASVATNRIRIDISERNANAGAQGFTIETGTVNTEVVAPWSYRTDRQPQVYDAELVADVYSDWMTGVVGLPARYIGPGPNAGDDRISKNLLAVDGLEELCRIAMSIGGSICESQGRIRFIEVHRPTATVLADFPMEEYAGRIAQGFKDRLPKFRIRYDWDGGMFKGAFEVQHAAALAAYGVGRVGEASRFELDPEVCKYFLGSKRPAEMAREIVGTYALGEIYLEVTPTIPHPELDPGDPVAVCTDRLALLDPVTGEAIRGPLWAIGRVLPISCVRGDQFTFGVLVRGVASLFAMSASAQKLEPFEPVKVTPVDRTPADRLDVARLSFRTFPDGATVKYYFRAITAETPDRASELWTTYTADSIIELLRDQSSVKALDYFGISNGIQSEVRTLPVEHDKTASADAIRASETAAGTMRWTAEGVDQDTRELRWYIRRNAAAGVYPTTGGGASDPLDETYLVGQWPVAADRGGRLYAEQTGYGAGDDSSAICVPIDYNGNPGTRVSGTFPYAGSVSPGLTSVTVTLNTAGDSASNPRTYDFAWTQSGLSDAAPGPTGHTMGVWAYVDDRPGVVVFLSSAPASGSPVTNQDIPWYALAGSARHRVVFEFRVATAALGIGNPFQILRAEVADFNGEHI